MHNTRSSYAVKIGDVTIGAGNPVVIQSMTNTDTSCVESTANQIIELYEAGSQIVRVTVNNDEAAQNIPYIVDKVNNHTAKAIPVVGDFHYNGHILLNKYPDMAKALSKYRINPGNVGRLNKHDENFEQFIRVAIKNNKPVRIGVNWGSLDQDLLQQLMDENARAKNPKDSTEVLKMAIIQSAINSADYALKLGLTENQIILSAKISKVNDLIDIYTRLAQMTKYPLHLGLTEAGMGIKGVVNSSIALGVLLHMGIGDTIRVSITPEPNESRTKEVEVCKQILQALNLKISTPDVTACPGCGRTTSTFFQELTQVVNQHLEKNRINWSKKYPNYQELKIAVMGCIVNGPGESKHADIGISLPGNFEEPKAPVFIDGNHVITLAGDGLTQEFLQIIDDYIAKKYG